MEYLLASRAGFHLGPLFLWAHLLFNFNSLALLLLESILCWGFIISLQWNNVQTILSVFKLPVICRTRVIGPSMAHCFAFYYTYCVTYVPTTKTNVKYKQLMLVQIFCVLLSNDTYIDSVCYKNDGHCDWWREKLEFMGTDELNPLNFSVAKQL